VLNSGRAPGQKGPAALALNVNGKMPAPPEKKPHTPQPQTKDEIQMVLEERTWEPDGSESNDVPGKNFAYQISCSVKIWIAAYFINNPNPAFKKHKIGVQLSCFVLTIESNVNVPLNT
jgi:hypothetical protein